MHVGVWFEWYGMRLCISHAGPERVSNQPCMHSVGSFCSDAPLLGKVSVCRIGVRLATNIQGAYCHDLLSIINVEFSLDASVISCHSHGYVLVRRSQVALRPLSRMNLDSVRTLISEQSFIL